MLQPLKADTTTRDRESYRHFGWIRYSRLPSSLARSEELTYPTLLLEQDLADLVMADNRIEGRLALVTGASGGLVALSLSGNCKADSVAE